MRENTFLQWMTENTQTRWCNDSALPADYGDAVRYGAIGCTTNPPLTYEAISTHPERYGAMVAEIKQRIPLAADRVVEYLGVVVRDVALAFSGIYRESGGKVGFVRSQVEPKRSADAQAMLEMGKRIASFGENVMVKIPGTKAGIWVLEELAALGIPTNPTVCVSVSQVIATAQAYERGCARAAKAGIARAQSTSALVVGRLQDYLAVLNEERGKPLAQAELDTAALAVMKRAGALFAERGYAQRLMPAAFRSPAQVTELVGGDFHMTIHPKIQDLLIDAERSGRLRHEQAIDRPVDERVVDKVAKALPEFRAAYEVDGMTVQRR